MQPPYSSSKGRRILSTWAPWLDVFPKSSACRASDRLSNVNSAIPVQETTHLLDTEADVLRAATLYLLNPVNVLPFEPLDDGYEVFCESEVPASHSQLLRPLYGLKQSARLWYLTSREKESVYCQLNVTRLGELSYYLGMKIERNVENGKIY